MTNTSYLKYVRIRLMGSPALLGAPQRDISFPDGNPIILTGANNSGKSLLASALSVILRCENWSHTAASLSQAGLQSIEIICEQENRVGRITVNLPDGILSEQWDPPLPASNGRMLPADARLHYLFNAISHISVVANNDISLPNRNGIAKIIEIARRPLEHELHHWQERRFAVVGADGHDGKLFDARHQYNLAEADLKYVRDLIQQIEHRRQKQDQLQKQLAELAMNNAVLKVEREEIEKKVSLAERAVRLNGWLREVRRDREGVEELRFEHSALQERLDMLTAKFRGAPDDFGSVLEQYRALFNSRATLLESVSELESRRERLQAELLNIQAELDSRHVTETEVFNHALHSLKTQIEENETKLVDLLRGRIALLRKREGIRVRLSAEFAEFDETVPPLSFDRSDDSKLFAGFETLPDNAETLLADLSQARQFLTERALEMEMYQRRREALEMQPGWTRHLVMAGIVGAISGVIMGFGTSWDIGLFTGLAVSGSAVLGFKYLRRHHEAQLEAAISAFEFAKERWLRAQQTKVQLENSLGPLAFDFNFEVARARLTEYRDYANKLSALPENPAVSSNKRQEYRQLLSERDAIEKEWQDYENGGCLASEIENLESLMSRLKRELEDMENSKTHAIREAEQKRSVYNKKVEALRSQIPTDEQLLELNKTLGTIASQMDELVSATGGLLGGTSPEILREEWETLSSLRSRLRQVKNSLSAVLSVDELHARETFLSDEYAEVNAKLQETDPVYLSQGVAEDFLTKYSYEFQRALDELAANKTAEEDCRRQYDENDTHDLESELSDRPNLDQLAERVEERKLTLEQIEREAATTRDLIAALSAEIDEYDEGAERKLFGEISELLNEGTEGQITAASLENENWFLTVGGIQRDFNSLSRGTADLARLLIRAAILEFVSQADHSPVLWDDCFSNFDESRLTIARDIVNRICAERHMVILTRNTKLAEWGTAIELQAPVFQPA